MYYISLIEKYAMANKNLRKVKKARNEEFYTQLCDIENELKHYKKVNRLNSYNFLLQGVYIGELT